MAVVIDVPKENKAWLDKATDSLKGLTLVTLGTVFVVGGVVGLAQKGFGMNLGAGFNDMLAYGTMGLLAVGGASAILAAPGQLANKVFSKHRNETAVKLDFSTTLVSDHLKTLGYDMNLEMGGRDTEKQAEVLNKRIQQISNEVHNAAKDVGESYQSVMTSAFIIGNEANRSDMTMVSAAEGLLAGLQIMKNDHSLITNPRVTLNGVFARDQEKKREIESGPSLG